MKIDVIIPAYRPGAEFLELIDRLERQTLPVSKILVMNTRSQVDVEKLLADRPEIQVGSLEKMNLITEGPGTARQGFLRRIICCF